MSTDEANERLIDPDASTGFGPQADAHAWSAGDPPEVAAYQEQPKAQQPQHHSWVVAGNRALLTVGIGATIAGALVFGPLDHSHASAHPAPAQPSRAPVATTPPTTLPPVLGFYFDPGLVTDAERRDFNDYLEMWDIPVNPELAFQDATLICRDLYVIQRQDGTITFDDFKGRAGTLVRGNVTLRDAEAIITSAMTYLPNCATGVTRPNWDDAA